MSNEFAVSAVSRALLGLMFDGVRLDDAPAALNIKKGIEHTILPLDRVRRKHPEPNVVNLFLYRVHGNSGYRNQTISGRTPLAINLEYLVTAYGEEERDEVAHFLIGKAMRVMHDHAILERKRLKDALEAARVHEQVENIRIAQQDLSLEELSKLWAMFQTQHYRISASYLVTVLLIESRRAAKAPLPVLKRGDVGTGWDATAGSSPLLESARASSGFSAVELAGELTLTGENLGSGGLTAIVRHPLMAAPETLPVTPVDAEKVKVTLPAGPASKWVAGIYSIALRVARSPQPPWLTNEVPFALAPKISVTPNVQNGENALFDLTIEARPQIRDAQPVLVLFGEQQLAPGTIPAPAGPNDPSAVQVKVKGPAGWYRVRLRVDGVDSIPIVADADTYKFDDAQSVEVKP